MLVAWQWVDTQNHEWSKYVWKGQAHRIGVFIYCDPRRPIGENPWLVYFLYILDLAQSACYGAFVEENWRYRKIESARRLTLNQTVCLYTQTTFKCKAVSTEFNRKQCDRNSHLATSYSRVSYSRATLLGESRQCGWPKKISNGKPSSESYYYYILDTSY